MANPVAVDPHVPAAMLRRRRLRVRPQLIPYAAIFLISTAGSIVIYYGAAIIPSASGGNGSRTAGGDDQAYALLAFLLSLLGIWLLLLALVVADRFPAATTLGEAIAMALRRYFGGGGRD